MLGPKQYGSTTYFGLNQIGALLKLKPRLHDPSRTVQPGTMAILNTDTGILEFLTGDWLTEFSRACETIVEPLGRLRYCFAVCSYGNTLPRRVGT